MSYMLVDYSVMYAYVRGMSGADDDFVQLAIRVPKAWLADADRVAEYLATDGFAPTRTDGFRVAIAKGLQLMLTEREWLYGDKSPKEPVIMSAAELVARKSVSKLGRWWFRAETLELVFGTTDGGWAVELERMTSSAPMLDAIVRVAGKSFLTSSDLGNFIRLLADVLSPASSVCPNGRDQTIDPKEQLVQRGLLDASDVEDDDDKTVKRSTSKRTAKSSTTGGRQ